MKNQAVAITREEIIAEICHEANKVWCEANGDFTQKHWEEAEQWQKDSMILGVNFRIANPNAKISESHGAWVTHKVNNGWVYGGKKDIQEKTHPCIVPFERLPEHQQKKDKLSTAIVDALW